MATSIFDKKENQPTDSDLESALKTSLGVWDSFFDYLRDRYGAVKTEWKFYSKNAGWTLKVIGEKRTITFLSPNDGHFFATVGMGAKGKEQALQADISQRNKELIEEARVYAEGWTILVKVDKETDLDDVKTILNIRDSI